MRAGPGPLKMQDTIGSSVTYGMDSSHYDNEWHHTYAISY